MKMIRRSYEDTEIMVIGVNVKCPYCEEEWIEEDKNECGETYKIKCDCGKIFEMYFDAD